MPKIIDPRLYDKAVRLYEEGATQAHCAEAIGVDPGTLREELLRRGVKIDGARRRRLLTDEQQAEVVALYKAYTPLKDIARAVGYEGSPGNIVYSVLRAHGVPRHSPADAGYGKTLPDGSTKTNKDGYVTEKVPSDWKFLGSMKGYGNGRWILQHRLRMAEHLDRPLTTADVVHHKDGDRSNNAIENLQLVSATQHSSCQAYRCRSCGSEDVEAVGLRT